MDNEKCTVKYIFRFLWTYNDDIDNLEKKVKWVRIWVSVWVFEWKWKWNKVRFGWFTDGESGSEWMNEQDDDEHIKFGIVQSSLSCLHSFFVCVYTYFHFIRSTWLVECSRQWHLRRLWSYRIRLDHPATCVRLYMRKQLNAVLAAYSFISLCSIYLFYFSFRLILFLIRLIWIHLYGWFCT